ncbi:bile acid:sodium symporter [Bradyrhizobium sp. Rc3b]|uniref:bile acid:sodium symporter n=1 Tax=Bradyrhizobium sp. Rc3b TaxID=1855322 RepID=UPI000B831D0D|nr:bile acid:sodium symporter [Bradyrhizobium sp. Rc3b]
MRRSWSSVHERPRRRPLLEPGADHPVRTAGPFTAGHALRPLIRGWVDRPPQLLSLIDRGSILLVAYGAFGAGAVHGLCARVSVGDLMPVGVLGGMLLAVMLVGRIRGARHLGSSREDEIAIASRGSKKSPAPGVPIAGAFFPSAVVKPG